MSNMWWGVVSATIATADCVVVNVTAWNCQVAENALETKHDCMLPGSQAVKELIS